MTQIRPPDAKAVRTPAAETDGRLGVPGTGIVRTPVLFALRTSRRPLAAARPAKVSGPLRPANADAEAGRSRAASSSAAARRTVVTFAPTRPIVDRCVRG